MQHAIRRFTPLPAIALAAVLAASCAAQIPDAVRSATTSTVPLAWGASRPFAGDPALLGAPGDEAGIPEGLEGGTVPAGVPWSVPAATGSSTTVPFASTTNPPTATSLSGLVAPVEVIPVLRTEESADPPYVVEISVPEVVGADDAMVGAVNDRISAHISATADPFIVDLVDYLTEFPPDPGTVTSSFEMGFEVTLLDEALLSIRFFESYYTAGAASANGNVSTLMFDLTTGAEITLDDVVLAGDGRVRLADVVAAALVDRYFGGNGAAFEPWRGGVAPDQLGRVALTRDGIELGFGQYQVGPGELGTPIVAIPYVELEGVLDPAGPAGRFIG